MKKSNTTNQFARYVTLNILGMIGLSCYILADTFFVARGIGSDGLTSLNLAIPIYSFVHGIGLMAGMGGATRFSISKSSTIFTQCFRFVLIIGAGFVAIGIFLSTPLAQLLGADAVTLQMTATYIQVILIFAPMFMLNNLLLCFVRNDGNPKLSMLAMLIGSFSNIILDYIFIFPCQMGMFGAVLATGIAPIISLIVLSFHFIRKNNSFHFCKTKLQFKSFKDISALGSPSLITELSSGIVMIVFNSIILNLVGNIGVAAYGVVSNISLVVISIFTGVAQGTQPLISGSFGRGKLCESKKFFSLAVTTAVVLSFVIYAVAFFFAEPIVDIFNKDHSLELAKIAVTGLRIYFTAFPFLAFNILTATFFSACDMPGKGLKISILRGFVVIISTIILCSSLFGMTGVWLALTISEFVVLFVSAKTLSSLKTQTEMYSRE